MGAERDAGRIALQGGFPNRRGLPVIFQRTAHVSGFHQQARDEIVAPAKVIGQFGIAVTRRKLFGDGKGLSQGCQRAIEVAGEFQHIRDTKVGSRQLCLQLRVAGQGSGQRFPNQKRLVVALQGANVVPEVGGVRVAQHVADPLVGGGQFGLQGRIATGFPAQAVEIFERTPDEQFASRRGTGHIGDRTVDLKDQRVGQLADVMKASLRDALLVQGNGHAHGERENDNHGGCHDGLVPADKFPRAIRPRVLARNDGQALQVTADVLAELLGRSIAPFRLLTHGLEHNIVEIAAEAALPLLYGALPSRACQIRSGRTFRLFSAPQYGGARPLGLNLADGPGQPGRALAETTIRRAPGQQLVQNHPERVDIAGGRYRLPPHLLGTRIFGREGVHERGFHARGRTHDFGNAEIQQFGHAVRRDQNIARLQVAMNDQVLMSIVDRRTDGSEQLQAAGDVERVLVAMSINGRALYQLHDNVGNAIVGGATIQQASNVRVVETGQDLALIAKALPDEVRIEPPAHHLDRDLAVEGAVGPDRAVNLPHTAAANLAKDLVGADPPAALHRGRWHEKRRQHRHRRVAQEVAGSLLVGTKKGFEFGTQGWIAQKDLVQVSSTLFPLQRKHCIEYRLEALPLLCIHTGARREISRCSQMRAVVHSRTTVAGEMPSTSEVSSIESPPKKRSSTMRLCLASSFASSKSASSSKITSTSDFCATSAPLSTVTLQAPPPRLAARWPRAYSTRICRINRAATPKKCARLCHSGNFWPISRT